MSAFTRLRLPALRRSLPVATASRRCFTSTASYSRKLAPSEKEEFAKFVKIREERIAALEQDDPSSPFDLYPRLTHRTPPVSIPELRKRHDGSDSPEIPEDIDPVTVYGRVVSKRQQGKYLLFLDVVNEYQTVQVMVEWNHIHRLTELRHARFKLFTRLLERGDHIAITGVPIRSPKGELTIRADHMPELLSPILQPLPTSYTDMDKKMERRHVDMMITPQVSDTLRMRSELIGYMRTFFSSQRFMEVQTPILALNASGAIARPFTTSSTEFASKELSLRVAPELWLKRLVVGGMQRVYEIGPAFRNEGIDHTHNPEFTMCEFYAAYATLEDLIQITEVMIRGLAREANQLIETVLTSLPPIDMEYFGGEYLRVEFVPGLEQAMGIKLPNLSSPSALPDTLAALALGNVHLPGEPPATIAKLLDRLAAEYLEPLSFEKPLFIVHHPAVMSPLAKSFKCPTTNQDISARTELFIHGRELANMYEEENNPAEQRRKMMEYRDAVIQARFENRMGGAVGEADEAEMGIHVNMRTGDVITKEEAEMLEIEEREMAIADAKAKAEALAIKRGWTQMPKTDVEEAPPVDERYVDALEAGLPPTGGWGCGIERLVMMFTGAKRISDCLPFGTLKNVVALGMPVGGQKIAEGQQTKKED